MFCRLLKQLDIICVPNPIAGAFTELSHYTGKYRTILINLYKGNNLFEDVSIYVNKGRLM